MMSIIIFALFLVPPFLLAYVHSRFSKTRPAIFLYYRYFMFFNMVFGGFFVALRMLFDGAEEAQLSGWQFSPVFYLYGVSLLSMSLMGVFTLFARSRLMLAPAILWSIFVFLTLLMNLIGMLHQALSLDAFMVIHMLYNFITLVIMLYFLWTLRQKI